MKKTATLAFAIFSIATTFGQNTFPSTGSAGIGTTSPAGLLDISSSVTSPLVGLRFTNTANTTSGGHAIEWRNTVNSGYKASRIYADIGSYGNDPRMYFQLGDAAGSPGWTNVMTLTNGKVGIGNTSPDYKLDIAGGSVGLTSLSAAPTNSQSLPGTVSFNGAGWNSYVGSTAIRGQINLSGSYSSTTGSVEPYLSFSLQGSGGFANAGPSVLTERMKILNNGNVGIGTSSPSEKLTVEGNVYANGNISAYGTVKTKKIIVTQTAWPDYVFERDYPLRSIPALEAFIKQNKHLPEMPSAKEIEEKGLSVGDTQAMLLKQIEEMTLYIIDLKKNEAKLTKRLAAIEKMLQKSRR